MKQGRQVVLVIHGGDQGPAIVRALWKEGFTAHLATFVHIFAKGRGLIVTLRYVASDETSEDDDENPAALQWADYDLVLVDWGLVQQRFNDKEHPINGEEAVKRASAAEIRVYAIGGHTTEQEEAARRAGAQDVSAAAPEAILEMLRRRGKMSDQEG